MIHTEWATVAHCSPRIHEHGEQIGEHAVDQEYALSLDTGSAVVIIEGTGDELSELFLAANDSLNQLLGMRDGYERPDRWIDDSAPF